MKTYMSFGGGVNSVALYLYLIDQGEDFEPVFMHHGTDWPETYQYLAGFQWWLKKNGLRPITVLRPCYEVFGNLYQYCWFRRMVPSARHRWCTARFKIEPIHAYVEKPCFMLLGIDAGEAHRAKISSEKGIEHRWPLIEAEIDRAGCEEIIRAHGLPVPMKSGCWICPYQRKSQWIELRRTHPELFCAAQRLEERNIEYQLSKGKVPGFLAASNKPLGSIVDEKQVRIFPEDEYPPCVCSV